ncbi:MAG: antibiotic biosynthesis monooxygenase [Prevotellaceae bacterium]|jgi:quinol monooxygenase YgiN|nr:antibiotic biosynthesis monooxygenase [Prevotellaceae bacterium]
MKKSILVMAVAFTATMFASCCGNTCNKEEQKAAEPAAAVKLVVTATINIPADKVEEFKLATDSLIINSRAEEGCLSYSLYQSASEANCFFFFEEWKDQAAIDAHFATPHFQSFGKLLEETGAETLIKTLEVSAEK